MALRAAAAGVCDVAAISPLDPVRWPQRLPAAYWLAGASVSPAMLPAAVGPRVALRVQDGRIGALAAAPQRDGAPVFELDGAVVFSAFVDAHTHLDKGDLLAAGLAPQRDLLAAIERVRADYPRWTEAGLRARMTFALRSAHAHGTRALNTYCDWLAPGGVRGPGPLAWQVLQDLRREWAGRVDLTLTSLAPLSELQDAAGAEAMARAVAAAEGIFGWFVYPGTPVELLPRAFDLAERFGLRLDFHIDEHLSPALSNLPHVLRLAQERGYGARTVCGHCCALQAIAADERDRLLDQVAAAGVGLVALPFTNLYLQDSGADAAADAGGARRSPQQRGLLPVHEVRRRGITLAFGSDNHRDPFFPYGDLDPLQTLALATLAAQLDAPVERWSDTLTTAPARLLHLPWDGVLRAGAPADLVIHAGRCSAEVLSRPGQTRLVLRAGQRLTPAEATPPDFRELAAT